MQNLCLKQVTRLLKAHYRNVYLKNKSMRNQSKDHWTIKS